MPEPTVPYKIRIPDSFKETWPNDKGYQATVVFECAWADRFALVQSLRGGYSNASSNFGQFTIPHRYPPLPLLYCREIADVKGEGLRKDLDAAAAKWAPYTRAVVTASYGAPEYNFSAADGSQSIDPQNDQVVPFCKQTTKGSAALVTLPEGLLKFAASGKDVKESVGKLQVQTEIVLEFPHVPFNPYPILRPFLGMLNSLPMFSHDQGEVVFNAIDTGGGGNASGGNADFTCNLTFLGRDVSWRKLLNDSGDYEPVVFRVGGKGIFKATNLWSMFGSTGRIIPIEDDPYAALY